MVPMFRLKILLSAALFAWPFLPAPAKGAFTIQFDYSYDTGSFFGVGSAERDRLEEAAAFFEGIISDDLGEISPAGGEFWGTTFKDPSAGTPVTLSVFDPPTFTPPPVIPADTLIVYVGARSLGTPLGEGAPGGVTFVNPGGGAWETTVTTRGESGIGDSDFAPWGGSLSINSATTWDLTAAGDGLANNNYHLYSVLLHELSHVLGVGEAASWNTQVSAGQFTGTNAVTANGGNVTLDPVNGHWVDGTTSTIFGTGTSQETALDPTLAVDTVKLMTDLDIAALQDIGWDIVTPVPEPGVSALLALAAFGLATRRRR